MTTYSKHHPVDLVQTDAYNFSSTSNTFVGKLGNFSSTNSSIGGVGAGNIPDQTAAETISGAWNMTSTSNTFVGNSYTVNAQTRYYTINASDWKNQTNSSTNLIILPNTGGVRVLDNQYIFAPINLPHLSVMTQAILYASTIATSSSSFAIYFIRYDGAQGICINPIQFNTISSTIDNNTINNSLYSYATIAYGANSSTIWQTRITYTITNPYP